MANNKESSVIADIIEFACLLPTNPECYQLAANPIRDALFSVRDCVRAIVRSGRVPKNTRKRARKAYAAPEGK